MLELKNITKVYGEKENAVHALKGVSLAFRKSEFVSILGQSGCGKTTLLNIIGGLDRYTDGDLIINGKSTKEYRDRDWDTYRNHSIGFIFQSYNLIPHLTILENVELTMTIGGVTRAERRKRAEEALISVGLGEKMRKKPNELSGGQMQRVSIARALAGRPEIILADEPTGALDAETGVQVMELLKEIARDKLVVMVTHNPELAERYSDRIIRMLDGVVTMDSDPFVPEECSLPFTEEHVTADSEKSSELNFSPSADTSTNENEISENTVLSSPESVDKDTETQKRIKGLRPHAKEGYRKKYSSMSFLTALRLSGKNLLSKHKRTIITSLAASIGIIGIAVILSVSSGMQAFIDRIMLDSASFNFISISSTTLDPESGIFVDGGETELTEYPENTTGIYPYEQNSINMIRQELSEEFIAYLESVAEGKVVDITYGYNLKLNILTKSGEGYHKLSGSYSEALGNVDYLEERYTVLASSAGHSGFPRAIDEVSLVVDTYNRLSTDALDALGIEYDENLTEIPYEELLGREFRVVFNDGWYTYNEEKGIFEGADSSTYAAAYAAEEGLTLKLVGVLRINEDASNSWLSSGLAYSPLLTERVLEENHDSLVALAQAESPEIDVTTGDKFTSGGILGGILGADPYEDKLEELGYATSPDQIMIYPTDVASREAIMAAIDSWNDSHPESEQVQYIDMAEFVTNILGTIVDVITYVLLAFSIVSLVISSIMIAIIIYASVIERTKEIGVLRSIGARKTDISNVFIAEAVILGLSSGVIAILVTLVINGIINAILGSLVGVTTIASLGAGTAFGLIALAAGLLVIASLIPARLAAKKEPAVALRTE